MPKVTAGGGVISAVETSSCRFKLSRVDSGLPPQRGIPTKFIIADANPGRGLGALRFFYAGQKFSRSFSGSSHVEREKQERIYI